MVLLRKLKTLRSLKGEEWQLIWDMLILSMAIPAGFRLFGVPRTQAYLRSRTGKQRPRDNPRLDHHEIIRSVRSAQRIVCRNAGLRGTCLTRSMALWVELMRLGLETDLKIGFRRKNGRMEGHAWIEYGGSALNEAPEVVATYTVWPGESYDRQWEMSA